MKTLTTAALVAVVCVSIPAFAQTDEVEDIALHLQNGHDSTRVRFGIGVYATAGSIDDFGIGVTGLSLQLGVQLNDRYAVYALVQGSTMLALDNMGNASLMVERQFLGRLSVATGVGVSGHATLAVEGGPAENGAALDVPLRIALNLGAQQPERARQSRYYVAIDGGLGAVVSSEGRNVWLPGSVAGYAGVSFGYASM